ncbi:hypothetical protein Noc_0681 [Nitrosococcus oceani ATCC 19707]|uniref:Uncharacterized protein n=1 Tax=Nitrosococcus oceani (strain ATCC 19707 / BCRC 17464 / JCM 30415 / NCIMB 11848 / C-107) TaxID=323261 RepID=Q3JD96_NITOC|nr:hypothetical protein [Nitrosococcus oceani]ABA57200.1 hypothetical protein Noc_0681 [Nitrosococcus oceani ATCC 19707]GEM21518.1 hypothetical protein NONS58_29620 [Nitrosococcus oceani]
MRITATHLAEWSDQRVAQGMLPIMVRRLINTTAQIKSIAMPGGESVGEPGWDGVLSVAVGNPWVPDGASCWELGTSADPARKARDDFKKRVTELSAEHAAQTTYVFVTSRRWREKGKWQEKARNQNVWADVLVWDADDLEAWLETSATTSLWMASQIGIAGPGIDSIETYWDHWHRQPSPILTSTALLVGREKARDELLKLIDQRDPLIAVMADSQSEAVGFAGSQLIESDYSQRAVCVTSMKGWQYVDANPGVELVIVANNQLASNRAPREGMSLIIPLAVGDEAFNLIGTAAKAADQKVIELSRPKPGEFEQALLEFGIAPSDAARYTGTLGRSWTVFRRMNALNPAVRKPEWIDGPNATSLHVLTLVGAWSGESQGDKACIEQVANRPYEEVEAELLELVLLDDAPVLKIGNLWKAKAPLELLNLVGPKLTGAVLSRFFQVARAVFEEPDPVLELEDDKRWMATIYGKVREHSGVVLDAMADSIAKLGYFADASPNAGNVGREVRAFIRQLLSNASEDRWLSVSQYLRSFAEAAPDEYLSTIQESLDAPEKPVIRLIAETQSSGVFGRCWHANLLWSLEILAWYPQRLMKVAEILAKLSETEVKGNWGNTPFNSLISLFRPWLPQTAATVDHRIRVVRNIVDQYPQIGWRLLLALAPNHHDFASANAKPRWREDDAGAEGGVTHGEHRHFVLTISSLLLDQSRGDAARIAELVPMIDRLGIEFREGVIALVNASLEFEDEDKEQIRSAIRRHLHWKNSFNLSGERHDRYAADALRPAFDSLAADDLVIRHAWLFSNGWVDLPDGREDDYEETNRAREDLRATAVREIFNLQGWQGINQLVNRSGDPRLIGWELVSDPFGRKELIEWLCHRYLNLAEYSLDSLTSGVLHAVTETECREFLVLVIAELERRNAQSSAIAGLMSNARQRMWVWCLIEEQAPEIREQFWKIARPYYVRAEGDDLIFCIEKLLSANRPRAAFEALGNRAADVPSSLLTKILEGIGASQEKDAPLPQPWNISRLFTALSQAGQLSQSELASLEFVYYKILHREEYGTPNLFAEILNSPESFIELICLVYKPRNSESEPIPESMQGTAQTAGSLLHNGRGIPGRDSNGVIDPKIFFGWVKKARELANEKDRLAVTDLTIGTWLSDWPCNKNLEFWPDKVIAELLDRDDCEDIRRGFSIGVQNSKGVSSRNPYDGGNQEREIANKFKAFAATWGDEKTNLSAMIEDIAKSFEHQARSHDDDALWTQES